MAKLQMSHTNQCLWAVLFGQLLLVCLMLSPFLFGSPVQLFADGGDGLKNYFTYSTYLSQTAEVPMLRFQQMQHPLGEYISYTDNTPLFALGMRLLNRIGLPISQHAFGWMNWMVCLGIVWASLFAFLLLKRWVSQLWLLSALSVLIPWLSPQLMRLPLGHLNLSFSWILLAAIYLLVREREHRIATGNISRKMGASLVALMLGASYLHLYYVPMLGLLIGWFYLASFLLESGAWRKKGPLLLVGLLIPLLGAALSWGSLRMIDGYYELRQAGAQGYNWSGWNLNPDALYTAYDFQRLPFPFRSEQWINTESYSYLGNFAIWGSLLFLLLAIALPGRKGRWARYFRREEKGKLALILVLSGLGCFFAALGEYAHLFQNTVKFNNPLTPFFYLSLLTEKVTHFRSVARFVWPFWLIVYLGLGYVASRFLTHPQWWRKGLVALLLLLGAIDAWDMGQAIRQQAKANPFREVSTQTDLAPLLSEINPADYQAMLPLPYFHVGSENYDLTIDPEPDWMRKSLQASALTGLPLMATVSSRTPVSHTRQLFEFVETGALGPDLQRELASKPILVLLSEDSTHWSMPPDAKWSPARETFLAGKTLLSRERLTLLAREGTLALYRWELGEVGKLGK